MSVCCTCRSSTHILRLAGTPAGLHSVSLLIKPARLGSNPSNTHRDPGGNPFEDTSKHSSTDSHTCPSSTTSNPACNSTAAAHAGAAAPASCNDSTLLHKQVLMSAPLKTVSSMKGSIEGRTTLRKSSNTAGCQDSRDQQPQSQPLPAQDMGSTPSLTSGSHITEAYAGSSTNSAMPERLRTKRRGQQGRPGRKLPSHQDPGLSRQTGSLGNPTNPQASHHPATDAGTGPNSVAMPTKCIGFKVQLQWEVGWNWRVGGPLASLTKQLEPATSSNGPSALIIQQLKAAYDPKARSYTLTAGGAGWNVVLAVPTQAAGFKGLVPRVWCAGCRPKVTLNLVPELL
jgi:hypothetical protein